MIANGYECVRHICRYTHMHARAHARTHTCTHARAHTHAHTHTQAQHVIVHNIWRFSMREVAMPFDALLEHAKLQIKARIITERFARLFKFRVVRACVATWHQVCASFSSSSSSSSCSSFSSSCPPLSARDSLSVLQCNAHYSRKLWPTRVRSCRMWPWNTRACTAM